LSTLPGVGQFSALVMLAEIGDITRFDSARKLASWTGLAPTVHGSDLTVRYGHISKQGSAWLRWVLNQAAHSAKHLSRSARGVMVKTWLPGIMK
jgi:transposase